MTLQDDLKSDSSPGQYNEHNKMTTHHVLPPLYTIDARATKRVWKVWTVGNTLYTAHGIAGGKMVQAERDFEGVNIGKANETDGEQQALLEAKRAWAKRLDKKYFAECEEGKTLEADVRAAKATAGGRNNAALKGFGDKGQNLKSVSANIVTGVETVSPMLCDKWDDTQTCLKYFDFAAGVYAQPKLDGWRCLATRAKDAEGNTVVMMYSRQQKQYPHFAKIRKELRTFLKRLPKGTILDGELYAHELHDPVTKKVLSKDDTFSTISGACSVGRSVPSEYEGQIGYFVYDIVDPTKTQAERTQMLQDAFDDADTKRIFRVATEVLHSKSDVEKKLEEYVANGYEGVILRAHDLKYETKKRSKKMRKLKLEDDAEYTIVAYKQGEGTEKGCVVWTCRTKDAPARPGVRFDVRPRGTQDERRELFKKGDDYIGKPLLVKYQGIGTNGAPRFPRGIVIREEFVE